MKSMLHLAALLIAAAAQARSPQIVGDYIEVRTCNVYAGGCVANGEMGVTGKEAILVWSVREGAWNHTSLDGLKVIAVLCADDTLGDLIVKPAKGRAALILDGRATTEQREALADLARTLGGRLIAEVASTRTADMEVALHAAHGPAAATVEAGSLVSISTLDLSMNKSACGGAETLFYPPLTDIQDARAGFTGRAAYSGPDLNRTWNLSGMASAYVGKFSR
jgi:hypothetical protein